MTTLQKKLRDEDCFAEDSYSIRHEAANALDAAEAKIARLKDVLIQSGFRECDIGACNCGSWHQIGGYRARFDEIKEVVEDAGYRKNGQVLLDAVKEMAAAAQPTAVGEDVVERAKDVIEDWLKQSRFADVDFPGIGARLIAEKLASANLLRTKDAG